jgi:tetratricopeptide (TPR) repeat protein
MPDQSATQANPAFRILVVVSRPLDQKELPTIADQWALINGLAAVKAPVEIKFLRPPTIGGLQTEILSGYDVLHFDGHGAFALACPNCRALNAPGSRKCGRCSASLEDENPRGYLDFELEDGTEDALAADELAEMLQAVPEMPIKLVILSACESAKGGDNSLADSLIKCGVPCVLGMAVSVPVALTIALSKQFYSGLGAGMTFSNAFKSGLSAISRLPDVEVKEPSSKNVKWIKAKEVPKLLGDGSITLTKPNTHGSLILEKMNLFGVPDYDFAGEYIPGKPPIGRKGLLFQAINSLNQGEKLVVFTGQGGIGKSVLAAVAARRISWRYPGGVFWRSAADIDNLDLNKLLDAFDNIFGIEFRALPLDAKQSKVLSYLQDLQTPCLVVVDNAETIQDPAIWRFLEGLPHPSAALVTTREALRREGKQISLAKMEPQEAFRLFVSEARRRFLRWGDKLNQADVESLEEITHLLDGHPLGIKLAAALVFSNSLESIRQNLRAAPPKEVSDRFDFSYQMLLKNQQELLQRMAAFASSVAEWAVEAISILSLSEDDKTELLKQWRDDLSELVRKSFIDVIELRGLDRSGNEISGRRYRMHPLMRQYASLKAGDAALLIHRKRASHLFLAYAERMDNCDALEAEHDNILAGADWAHNAKEWTLVTRFAFALDTYLETRGYWKDSKHLLANAVKATNQLGDKSGMAATLHMMGNSAYRTGDLPEALRLYKESLKIEQELGDKHGEAQTLHQMGVVALLTGNLPEVRRLCQESLKIEEELGAKGDMAGTLQLMGMLAQDTGDLPEALRLYKESLKIKQELGDKHGEAQTLHQMGNLAYLTGDPLEARRLYQQSLKIEQELGDKRGEAQTLHQMGMLAQATRDVPEAHRLYQESLKIEQELGDKHGMAATLHMMGNLAYLTGDPLEARRLYQQSLKIKQELGDKHGMAITLAQFALLEEEKGNNKKALDLIKQAEGFFLELRSPMATQARRDRERLEKKR